MAVATQTSHGVKFSAPAPAARARTSTMLLVAAFGAIAVMVGRDGSLAWQLVRVAIVAVLTAVAVAGAGRLSERGRGWLSVVVGAVVLAVGVGFLPYLLKEKASL